MFTPDQIKEIRAAHPEVFAQKIAALKDEQMVCQVILDQVEHDKQHPPHLEAVAATKRLIVLVNAKGAEFQRLKAEVIERVKALGEHAELLDIRFISVDGISNEEKRALLDSQHADLNRLLDECREFSKAQEGRIIELEGFLDTQGKTLADIVADNGLKAERILQLEAERDQALGDLDALKGVNAAHLAKLTQAEADLKAAQEALKAEQAKPKKK